MWGEREKKRERGEKKETLSELQSYGHRVRDGGEYN